MWRCGVQLRDSALCVPVRGWQCRQYTSSGPEEWRSGAARIAVHPLITIRPIRISLCVRVSESPQLNEMVSRERLVRWVTRAT